MRRLLLRLVQALLIAAIAWGVWRALAPALGELAAEDFLRWRPSPVRLAISIALLIGVYLAHAFLWRRILRDLDIGRPDARTVLRIHFLASLGRYLPGKVWQLAGLAVLARDAGLPGAASAAAAVLGQFAFLTTGLLLLALLLPEWAGGIPAVIGTVALIGSAGALWILVATPAGHAARVRLRSAAGERVGARLDAALSLADRIRPVSAMLWLAGYGLSWVLLGMAFTVFTTAFVPGSAAGARELAGSLAASYLAGYITLIPAGLGVREGALVTLLARISVIPVPAALVIALASRVWFTAAELLPLLCLPLLRQGRGVNAETSA
jgi:hypothetical protein